VKFLDLDPIARAAGTVKMPGSKSISNRVLLLSALARGNTLIRDLSARRPPRRPGGAERLPAWERVDAWAARQPKKRWRPFTVRDGEKGPLQMRK